MSGNLETTRGRFAARNAKIQLGTFQGKNMPHRSGQLRSGINQVAYKEATMATMNPTAVQKTVDALTNQEILTSIIKKSEQIEHEDFTIELAGAILDNPEAGKLVDWLADGKDMAEQIASALASLITAARMPLTKEKPAKEAAKKFVPPFAKVLLFNVEGKVVVENAEDRAYLIEKGHPTLDVKFASGMKFLDWEKEHSFKTEEERDKAFNALAASPNPPRWMVEIFKGPTPQSQPTPPAA
jgi:hypothetical protein